MGKPNRATRKELEKVIPEIIRELQSLKQFCTILDNYIGAYVEYKGDAVEFPNHLQKKFGKLQKEDTRTKEDGMKSDKEARYKKISTPSL